MKKHTTRNFLNLIKDSYKKLQQTYYLIVKCWKLFLWYWEWDKNTHYHPSYCISDPKAYKYAVIISTNPGNKEM